MNLKERKRILMFGKRKKKAIFDLVCCVCWFAVLLFCCFVVCGFYFGWIALGVVYKEKREKERRKEKEEERRRKKKKKNIIFDCD